MAEISDKEATGYRPRRDHEKNIHPDLRCLSHGVRVQFQTDEGLYDEVEDFGDTGCWHYWEKNDDLSFLDNSGSAPETPEPDEGVGGTSREVCIHHVAASQVELESTIAPRRLGLWSQCTPCIVTERGLFPIQKKTGLPDVIFKPKQFVFSDFDTDPNNPGEVVCAAGKGVAIGTRGILTQCAYQDGYELWFFPISSNLVVDHDSVDVLSTNVFAATVEGILDTENKHAAALDSAWRIVRDENGAKIIAINATQAGRDSTGFGGVFAKSEQGEERLVYLSYERNGFLHPGDNSTIRHLRTQLPFTPGSAPVNENPNIGGAQIWTLGGFYQEKGREGNLAFTKEDFPALVDPTREAEVKLVLDKDNKVWRWIVRLEGLGKRQGKIAWCIQQTPTAGGFITSDLSEGELLDDVNTLVWIDYEKSTGFPFRTVGNGTIFDLELLKKDHVRLGETRDLYKAVRCTEDKGQPILFFHRDNSTPTPGLVYNPSPFPVGVVGVVTTIGGQPKHNLFRVKIPCQWLTDGQGFYEVLELVDGSYGHDFVAAPVNPEMTDNSQGLLQSRIFQQTSTIANYKIPPVATQNQGVQT